MDHIHRARVISTNSSGIYLKLENGIESFCEINDLGYVKPQIDDSLYVKFKGFNGDKRLVSLKGIDQQSGVLLDEKFINNPNSNSVSNKKLKLPSQSDTWQKIKGGKNWESDNQESKFKRKELIDDWELTQINAAYGAKRQRIITVDMEDPFAETIEEDNDHPENVNVQLNTAIPTFLENKKEILIQSKKPKQLTEKEIALQRIKNRSIQYKSQFDEGKKNSMSDIANKGSDYLAMVKQKKIDDKREAQREERKNQNLHDPLHLRQVEIKQQQQKELEKLEKIALDNWRQQSRSQSYGIKSHKSIQEQRDSLPVKECRNDLLKIIRNNDFVVVVGETGSGKSTQITQYLAEDGYILSGLVGCTQPRRVAAISVAKRVADEVGCKIGDEVGYTIRFEDCTSNKTKIKYMTDGMLQREALIDPDMKKYSVIMLDEAHERTISTDILFALLRDAVIRRNGSLKLIITSATLDSEKFSNYFNNCPIFHIKGRTFPVKTFYTKKPEMDYIQATIDTVIDVHTNSKSGDILVFLTGREEIETCCESIVQKMSILYKSKPNTNELIILPIYSAMPSEMQSRIFEPTPANKRKVVIATNIAETSITIDGIYYVIDPGYVKVNAYDAKLGMDTLIVKPISRAQADQRSGRAGRTGPGICYRLYTKNAYTNEMEQNTSPEILRQNLSNTILMLKAMGIENVLNFGFMDRPKEESMLKALEELYILDALDDNGQLTKTGKYMAHFPMEPMLAKTLIKSFEFKCSYEIVEIISMLSVPEIFYRPRDKRDLADKIKRRFDDYNGDHLTLLNVYRKWEDNDYSRNWCQDNFVQEKSLRKARDVKRQIFKLCDNLGKKERNINLKIESCKGNLDQVRKAFVSGYFRNTAKKSSTPTKDKAEGGYKTLADDISVHLHPSSSLFNKNGVDYVLYHTLVLTNKEYMHCVTKIDPKWLIDYAPRFFRQANQDELSISKKREKIKPLFNRHDPNESWRLSKGRR
ncbi:DEAH-box ATP-dependent RNA helicase [Martiniozyma asiatica (nom. inval.)]|nr:DEAH-box ATP-dependent RNA helicase [Martiniozyma asiatica]